MFEATLISIAHDVCRDLRLQKPRTLFGLYDEGDTTADDMNRAATKTARFLLSYHTWEHLQGKHEWTVTADVVQPVALTIPADFHRLVPRTIWDDQRRVFLKECSIDEWSRLHAGGLLRFAVAFTRAGVRLSHPNVGAKIKYDYMRKVVCKTTGQAAIVSTPSDPCGAQEAVEAGVYKAEFTRDDDIPLWDSELFTLGMIWNKQHRDGNTNNEDYQAFVGRLHETINHDAPSGVLNMNPTIETVEDGDVVYPTGPWGTKPSDQTQYHGVDAQPPGTP